MPVDRAIPPIAPRLSKSKFMTGLQCHKRLYLEVHAPELATESDEQTQAIFERGTQVGQVAQQMFPGGVLVGFNDVSTTQALAKTRALLADVTVPAIFEGAFQFDDVLIRVDILERDGQNEWRLIEVKSSTEVKPEHHDDLAVQAYVLKGAGLSVMNTILMHLNNQYVYQGGELDLSQLFVLDDVSAETTTHIRDVPDRLATMKTALKHPVPPAIEPDGHCKSPYKCSFWEHCTQNKPARWVYHLPRIGKKFEQLVKLGVESIDDIPSDFPLSLQQRRVKDQREWVDSGLKAALSTVRYPVHHLDFETVKLAIPRYPNTRPYQTLPTQWSNHIEARDGSIRHDEFLCADRQDPREEFARALIESVGDAGSICVYTSYERRILGELAEALPKLRRPLQKVLGRLWDLNEVIRDHYYHPQFEGSFSLKTVLPAIVPSLNYDDLAIQDGGQAEERYYQMVFGDVDAVERERIRQALLLYCARDTLAMVELRKALHSKAGRPSARGA